MPRMILNITPDMERRINDWSREFKEPPESLAVGLLEEYFEDCDDAEKLEALIASGQMKTYPLEEVHKELEELDAVAG